MGHILIPILIVKKGKKKGKKMDKILKAYLVVFYQKRVKIGCFLGHFRDFIQYPDFRPFFSYFLDPNSLQNPVARGQNLDKKEGWILKK